MSFGISAAGIQRPLVFPYLPNHPVGEVTADSRFRLSVAECPVCSVDSFSQLGGVTGGFSLVAPAIWCTSPQLIRKGFGRFQFTGAYPVDKSVYYPKSLDRDTKARDTYRREIKKSKSYQDDIFVLDILREEMKGDDPRIQRILFE